MSKKMNPNVSSRDYVDREYWAASPHATQEELDFLSNDKSWEVRKEVAKNINSSQKTLNKLAKDNGVYVKEAVAANPNLSEETFIYLFDQSFYASLYKQVKIGTASTSFRATCLSIYSIYINKKHFCTTVGL